MKKDTNTIVANNIKKYRLEKKMTLLQLAKAVGITESTMQKYETNAIKGIELDRVISIANALGIAPEQLTEWDAHWELPREHQQMMQKFMALLPHTQETIRMIIDREYEALNQ